MLIRVNLALLGGFFWGVFFLNGGEELTKVPVIERGGLRSIGKEASVWISGLPVFKVVYFASKAPKESLKAVYLASKAVM